MIVSSSIKFQHTLPGEIRTKGLIVFFTILIGIIPEFEKRTRIVAGGIKTVFEDLDPFESHPL